MNFNTMNKTAVKSVIMHFVFRTRITDVQTKYAKTVSDAVKAKNHATSVYSAWREYEVLHASDDKITIDEIFKKYNLGAVTMTREIAENTYKLSCDVIRDYEKRINDIKNAFDETETYYNDMINDLIVYNKSDKIGFKCSISDFNANNVANKATRNRFAFYASNGGYITPANAISANDRKLCNNAKVTLGYEFWCGLKKADMLHLDKETCDTLVELLNLRKRKETPDDTDKSKESKKLVNAEIEKAITEIYAFTIANLED